MKQFTKYCIAIFLGTLLLVSCGNSENSSTIQQEDLVQQSIQETQQNMQATEVTTNTMETIYPATIIDSNGEEVVIEAEPSKIVSMGPNITEMIFALGVSDKLIGRTTYCDYPAEAAEIEAVGTLYKPDIEKIINLKPDILIASTHFSSESEEQLKELGIKVIVLYEEHEMSGVYTMIDTLGIIVNKSVEAQKIINQMKEKIEAVQEKVKDFERPSVYYVVGFGESGDYTAGGDTFVAQLLELAGGNNIAKDASGWNYTLESLIEADPDIIVVKQGMKEEFISSENYKELSAVKNNQVYEIDNNLLDRQGVRNAEGVEELAKIFHME